MKTVKDFEVKNKRVLVRCDFNVPLDENGNIADDFRIRKTLPTLRYLQENGARIILASHFSDGKSLEPVWKRVRELLSFGHSERSEESDREAVTLSVSEGPPGIITRSFGLRPQDDIINNVTFLENLRLNEGEEKNSDDFAKELAGLADIYINDAFSVCHRAHASVVGTPKYLPSGAGFLLEKEVTVLSKIIQNPDRPFAAIIGGVKFESKAKVIDSFLEVADFVLVGGKIGLSPEIKKLNSPKLVLPVDNIDTFDIGPETIKLFSEKINKAKTIIWAGPIGLFEEPAFENGTKEIGEAICNNEKAFKIAGGGDTISAINKFNLQDKFDHLSTGGGAMLKFIAGDKLPGLEALGYYK